MTLPRFINECQKTTTICHPCLLPSALILSFYNLDIPMLLTCFGKIRFFCTWTIFGSLHSNKIPGVIETSHGWRRKKVLNTCCPQPLTLSHHLLSANYERTEHVQSSLTTEYVQHHITWWMRSFTLLLPLLQKSLQQLGSQSKYFRIQLTLLFLVWLPIYAFTKVLIPVPLHTFLPSFLHRWLVKIVVPILFSWPWQFHLIVC